MPVEGTSTDVVDECKLELAKVSAFSSQSSGPGQVLFLLTVPSLLGWREWRRPARCAPQDVPTLRSAGRPSASRTTTANVPGKACSLHSAGRKQGNTELASTPPSNLLAAHSGRSSTYKNERRVEELGALRRTTQRGGFCFVGWYW
ncbi:hypothetical protein MRB53_036764 [Persea americana]|nr:hypothetical protein MRB53_036764 [Persea americana]